MKKEFRFDQLVALASLSFVFVFGFGVLAANSARAEGPCKKLKAACEAAGYTKGGHKNGNKGLHIDCMKPLLSGGTVAGVTVDAADVTACQEKRSKKGK